MDSNDNELQYNLKGKWAPAICSFIILIMPLSYFIFVLLRRFEVHLFFYVLFVVIELYFYGFGVAYPFITSYKWDETYFIIFQNKKEDGRIKWKDISYCKVSKRNREIQKIYFRSKKRTKNYLVNVSFERDDTDNLKAIDEIYSLIKEKSNINIIEA